MLSMKAVYFLLKNVFISISIILRNKDKQKFIKLIYMTMMMIYQCTLDCQSHVVHRVAKIPFFSSYLVLKVLVLAVYFSCGISHKCESSSIDTSGHPPYHRCLACVVVAFCQLVRIYCHCFTLFQCPIFPLSVYGSRYPNLCHR